MAVRAYPSLPLDEGIFRISGAILNYDQMWHDAGNADPILQISDFHGREPLFDDGLHNHRNPNVTASDYLFVFKKFMRIWAARKNEDSSEANWFKMQQEYADELCD